MSNCATDLSTWTHERIDAECRDEYRVYEADLKAHYVAYFASRPNLRCRRHPYSAASAALALPPDWEHLQRLIAPPSLHRYARSGRSSQMLALALLGSSAHADPSLDWLWGASQQLPLAAKANEVARFAFEYALQPCDLNEKPHVTTLDFVAANRTTLAVTECKWSERGFGTCSCTKDGDGEPGCGNYCARRVETRQAYWKTAHRDFGFDPARLPLLPCPLNISYQAIRNVAAARLLRGRRQALFLTLYDQTNPYFKSTGSWPGWPIMLNHALSRRSNVSFRAVSWQHLMPLLPLPSDVRDWAAEKHRLAT